MTESDDRTRTLLALAGVLLLAALLRFPGIGTQSLWIDEAYSNRMAEGTMETLLMRSDGHPPLYALAMKAACPVLETESCGRVVSAWFGLASVALVFLLGMRLYDRRVGILAALLLAISPMHIWYSREARMYALLLFLSVAATLLVWSLSERSRLRTWIAFAAVSTLGMLTHYVYFGMLAAHGLFLVHHFGLPVVDRRLLTAGGLAALAVGVVGVFMAPDIVEDLREPLINHPRDFNLYALPYTLYAFITGFGIGPSLDELHRSETLATVMPYWREVLPAVLVCIAVAGLAAFALLRREARAGLLAAIAITVPLMAYAVSWIADGPFNARYVITALPPLLIAVAATLARQPRAAAAAFVGVLMLVSAVSTVRVRTVDRYVRADYRSAVAYLRSVGAESDRVYVSSEHTMVAMSYYYGRERRLELLPQRPILDEEAAAETVDALVGDDAGSWLVISRAWVDDPKHHFERTIADNPQVVLAWRLPGGVEVYRIGDGRLARRAD